MKGGHTSDGAFHASRLDILELQHVNLNYRPFQWILLATDITA